MSTADASTLELERGGRAYTIGMVALLPAGGVLTDRGVPDLDRLRQVLGPRVAAVPRLNQRVAAGRRGGRLWVDSPADLSRHVRSGPRVLGHAALAELCGQLLTVPLPRDRPLWDVLVVPGPDTDRIALVLRLHHAIADGISAVHILRALVDPPPATQPPPAHDPPASSRRGRWDRAAGTALAAAAQGVSILRAGRASSSLVGPVGPRRGVGLVSVDLATFRAAAHARGATVNDALLAAVVEAAGALLTSRGERVRRLTVSVPVAVAAAPRGAGGNRIGVMVVPLPLDEPDPVRLLHRVTTRTRRAKTRARVLGPFVLTRTRLGTRLLAWMSQRQRIVSLFVTNVPGPRERLTLAGAPLLAAWPLSVVAGNVRVAVAALSYEGRLGITVAFDADSTPDAEVFTSALRRAVDRAVAAGTTMPGPS